MLVLVDEFDNSIGEMEKMEVHQKGLLHRAFSVFIFNSKDELLLQRRALNKYHSAGLWTNTCCSHPKLNEDLLIAAKLRLKEEMGLDVDIVYKSNFIYKASFDNDLIEYEFDHVFVGICDKDPIINHEEVDNYQWIKMIDLKQKLNNFPQEYSAWLKIAIDQLF